MFPTAQFHDATGCWSHQLGDWSGPADDAQNHDYYGTYGFDTEAVYGLEPEAGPSTVIPALTYEDPPATTRPYVPPGYETQDEWNVPPAMTQPAYTSLAGWDGGPPIPPPFFYPEHTSSGLEMGTDEPIVAIPPPTQPPVPSSSSTQRAEKRGVNLSPTEISTFKERLREAQPPGGYKPETAIAATSNTLKDRLPATGIGLSSRPHFDEELYLEDVLKKHLGAYNKANMYQKLANRLESMEVVNTSPVIRGRPSGSQSRRNGGTQVAMRKVEASAQRRRHERAILELVSQRFKLPIGKRKFSKIEVLSLALTYLITTAGPEETDPTEG